LGKTPSASLKNKILDAIRQEDQEKQEIQFPPLLKETSVADWLKYIEKNKITVPASYDTIHLVDLPGDEKQVTYIVWAQKGAVVEEAHEDEDEYLLMLKGHCAVTINGRKGYYKEGDLIYIPKKSVHLAEALSDEPMLLVGQRLAA